MGKTFTPVLAVDGPQALVAVRETVKFPEFAYVTLPGLAFEEDAGTPTCDRPVVVRYRKAAVVNYCRRRN